MRERRNLYPDCTPYRTGFLDVGEGHRLYFEESGNSQGRPALFLHGGPGGGTQPMHRRYFDPDFYRIILFDQRGCGRSTPFADIAANTTWHLIGDIEALRRHLEIERWLVFGGSWGSTLALAYAESFPMRVSQLVLRGIFLLRAQEIAWFYQRGADALYPDAFAAYLDAIPEDERDDLLAAYHRRLTSPERSVQLAAARAWSVWEGSTLSLLRDPAREARFAADDYALAFARIECHYFFNKGFFREDNQLLADIDRIRHIPGIIVQGRYDVVTPMRSAYDLSRAWPEAKFEIAPDAGHAASEPGIIDALVRATDAFRN